MNNRARINVIVPIYKVEAYLERCIKSIVEQTYRDLEIILVDDGSPDHCPEICDQWAKKDGRIRVIHKENGGLSDARNAGLKAAEGEYIAFVDSDDYIAPNYCEKLYDAIVTNSADMAICNYTMVDEQGNRDKFDNADLPIRTEVLTGKDIFVEKQFQKKKWYWVVAWNKLYKKEFLQNLQFIKGKYHEDEYFFNQIMTRAQKVACVETPLYYYVQRDGSIMGQGAHTVDTVGALSERIMIYLGLGVNPNTVYEKVFMRIPPILVKSDAPFQCNDPTDKYDNKKLFVKAARELGRKKIRTVRKAKCELWGIAPEIAKICTIKYANLKTRKHLITYKVNSQKYSAILLDTPTHINLGDHAIVLAEQQVLAQCGINSYELTASQINGREAKYAVVTRKNQCILVHGGGFLGSLWPNEEERFRRILQAFHKQKIIVFPQTVTFDTTTPEGRKYLEESQRIYASHPDLTIFVREKRSYAFMQQYFPTVRCLLVPDIVTLLRVPDTAQTRRGVLFCMRRDLEKALDDAAQQEMLAAVKTQYPDEAVEFTDTVIEHDVMPEKREEEVNKKLVQFSGARLIVTDRLHGMVFAALTNTPCIAMSNSNGKVKAVYEWIKGNDYIRFANSVEEFKQQLQSLDVNRPYTYDRELTEREFAPLLEEIRKLQK